MSHHDRWIQGCEIESSDRIRVKPSSWLDDNSAFILVSILAVALDWDNQVVLSGLAIQLGSDLDLLSASEKENDRHTCDSCHFNLIEDTHQLFHQSQRQVGILYAVDSETTS